MFWCSSLTNHLKDLRSWLCNRGYAESMVKKQLRRAENRARNELWCTNSCVGKEVGVPLIVTYHLHLNGLNKIMQKNLKHLQANQTVKSVFTPAPFVPFCTARNVRSHLVWSKFYPLQRATGSYKCNTPRCQVGKNVKECSEFSSHVTQETFKINHYFDCNSKSLIYLISCKVCDKQYVESTTERFRLRWNNYKSCQRKAERREEDCMQRYLYEHFLSEGHNSLINDIEIIFTDIIIIIIINEYFYRIKTLQQYKIIPLLSMCVLYTW